MAEESGLSAKKGAPGNKGHAFFNGTFSKGVAVFGLATYAGQLRPEKQPALGLAKGQRRHPVLVAKRSPWPWRVQHKHERTLAKVAGMRPAFKYCAAVAWANVDVCASLNCLHMVALANNSEGQSSSPNANRVTTPC
jgi:hypothetical protein